MKRSHVFISHLCDIFFPLELLTSFLFKALICAPPIKPGAGDLSGTCKFMSIHLFLCALRLRVCVFMSSMWRKGRGGRRGEDCGCIWTLGSRLNRLSHPQPSPGGLGVSINNQSL